MQGYINKHIKNIFKSHLLINSIVVTNCCGRKSQKTLEDLHLFEIYSSRLKITKPLTINSNATQLYYIIYLNNRSRFTISDHYH